MGGPVRHEFPAPLDQIATPGGDLDAVAVEVHQGELADLARRVGARGRQVPTGTALVESRGQGRVLVSPMVRCFGLRQQ